MGSMLELEKEVSELRETVKDLRQRMLTSELHAGIMFTNIIRVLHNISPNHNAADVLLEAFKRGESAILESDARNDPHTKDAYIQAIKTVERALKK